MRARVCRGSASESRDRRKEERRTSERERGREGEVALGSRESRHARALVDATSSFLT